MAETDFILYGARNAYTRLNLVGGRSSVTLVWDDNATAGIERNNLGPGSICY
jgi:hypothetical protein